MYVCVEMEAVKVSKRRIVPEKAVPVGIPFVSLKGVLPGRAITMDDVEQLFGSYQKFKQFQLYGDQTGIIAVKKK